jgi:hypothetical protein
VIDRARTIKLNAGIVAAAAVFQQSGMFRIRQSKIALF